MLPWKRKRRKEAAPEAPAAPAGGGAPTGPSPAPSARRLSELWSALQAIAREEDPRFESLSVVEHSQRNGAEGARDICRWLEIHHRRVDPAHRYRFPHHHPRYRGFVLIERNWPTGISWEACDEASLLKLDVPAQGDRPALERAIDARLEARGSA